MDKLFYGGDLSAYDDVRKEENFVYLGMDRDLTVEAVGVKHHRFREAWYRFCHSKGAFPGLVILVLLVILSIAAPILSHVGYADQDLDRNYYAPRVPGIERLGILNGDETAKMTEDDTFTVNKYKQNGDDDIYFFFGSDSYGRDVWTRLWSGTRVSLIVALAASLIDLLFGTLYGILSGYLGGTTDIVMQRIIEILDSIPGLVIVTLLMLVLKPGLVTIIVALMITSWIGMSRIARAEVLRIKKLDYILASRTLGAGGQYIIFKEIFPNMIGQMISRLLFSVPGAIFLEAFLSFLGLGIPQPLASLGSLISSGYGAYASHPYMIVPPVVVMIALMLSFNLIAGGVQEAFDPGKRRT